MASAPSPRPGTVLGSGKTQKTGSISANNSATASVCAAQASGAAGPGSRSPAAGARWEAGASLDAAESAGGACRAALQRLGSGGGMERKGKTYLGAEGSAGLRLQTPDAAGVWHRGPRRKALAQLRAGLHFARTGNSPCHPTPRGALRCHRTERYRHALQSLLVPGGSFCLPLAVRLLPHGPHPVTSAALHSFLFDTSTGYSAVSVLPPLSAHVLLPLPPL